MLDSATMMLLSKVKILAKQSGINIDLIKMSEDKDYAVLTLKELSNSDDPELVMIVINLMNQFGMIKAPVAAATVESEEKNYKERYVGKLR
jgi:hypothetical protein